MLCVVCKKLWVPGSAHSFHKFPRDSNRRQKWMEIVGISKITSNASVCSDHFTPESYHQTDGYTTVKRLLSTAEPIIDKGIQVLRDVTINATTNRPSEHQSTSCLEYFMNTSGDKQKDAIVDHCTTTNSINDNHTTTDDTATNLSEKGLLTRIHSGNNVINKIIEKQGCSVNNTSDSNQSQNVNRVESNRSKKRNIVNDQESCSNKRFRFMDGYLVKTISRHDFTTDKAWETFMRYVTIQRNKHVINRRKILRKQNKVKSFQDLIDNLKAKETEAAAKYTYGVDDLIKEAKYENESSVSSIVPRVPKKKKFTSSIDIDKYLHSNIIIAEHDYSKHDSWVQSEYLEHVIKHTCGAVLHSIIKKINCEKCVQMLRNNNSTKSKLTVLKNWGGLQYASNDVYTICLSAERIIRKYKACLLSKNIYERLMLQTLKIIPTSILDNNEHSLEQTFLNDHRQKLIYLIIESYLNKRLKHESKKMGDLKFRIRMLHNKLTIFKGE